MSGDQYSGATYLADHGVDTWTDGEHSIAHNKVLIVDGATVLVAVVTSRLEADLIVGLLRSNGLHAASAPDDAGGTEPQLQLQGVRVLVAPADEVAARRLLAETTGTES